MDRFIRRAAVGGEGLDRCGVGVSENNRKADLQAHSERSLATGSGSGSMASPRQAMGRSLDRKKHEAEAYVRKKETRSDDFNEEIKAHIQLEADQLVKEGMNHREAESVARRAFGNVTSSRERFYESGRWISLDHLKVDIRYALRRIRKSPVWSATVILSLRWGSASTRRSFP